MTGAGSIGNEGVGEVWWLEGGVEFVDPRASFPSLIIYKSMDGKRCWALGI